MPGLRLVFPIVISYFFLSISYAIFAKSSAGSGVEIRSGIANYYIIFLSLLVYAGAAQFLIVDLLKNNFSTIEIIFSALFINLRMSIYSFSFLAKIKELSLLKKLTILIGITDENYVLFNLHQGRSWTYPHLGMVVFLCYFAWNLGTWVGTFFLTSIPEVIEKNTQALYYLLFIILLYESLKKDKKYIFLVGLTVVLNISLNSLLNDTAVFFSLMVSSLLATFIFTGIYFTKKFKPIE